MYIPYCLGIFLSSPSSLSLSLDDCLYLAMICCMYLFIQSAYLQIELKKLKHKMIFAVSVMSVIALAYCTVLYPWFLPYYHTIVFPILYIIRLVSYR